MQVYNSNIPKICSSPNIYKVVVCSNSWLLLLLLFQTFLWTFLHANLVLAVAVAIAILFSSISLCNNRQLQIIAVNINVLANAIDCNGLWWDCLGQCALGVVSLASSHIIWYLGLAALSSPTPTLAMHLTVLYKASTRPIEWKRARTTQIYSIYCSNRLWRRFYLIGGGFPWS